MEWLILGVATAVNVALWFFQPTWLRRRLGIETDPAPDPYPLRVRNAAELRREPVIGELYIAAEERGATLSWSPPNRAGRLLLDGYDRFLTPSGQPCIDNPGPEEQWLLVKEPSWLWATRDLRA